jgi:hypothetical protein
VTQEYISSSLTCLIIALGEYLKGAEASTTLMAAQGQSTDKEYKETRDSSQIPAPMALLVAKVLDLQSKTIFPS